MSIGRDRFKGENDIQIHACNSFLPDNLKSVGDKANHEGVLNYADVAFPRAKKIEVKGSVFGRAASRRIPDDSDLMNKTYYYTLNQPVK